MFFQNFSFWKGFSAEHCLLLDKWNRAVKNYQAFGNIATDLPKTFDYLNHFRIAKVYSHGLPLSSLRGLADYLRNKKQRITVESAYSSWNDTKYGVPQGSILGPLPFNIFCATCS